MANGSITIPDIHELDLGISDLDDLYSTFRRVSVIVKGLQHLVKIFMDRYRYQDVLLAPDELLDINENTHALRELLPQLQRYMQHSVVIFSPYVANFLRIIAEVQLTIQRAQTFVAAY